MRGGSEAAAAAGAVDSAGSGTYNRDSVAAGEAESHGEIEVIRYV